MKVWIISSDYLVFLVIASSKEQALKIFREREVLADEIQSWTVEEVATDKESVRQCG